ncbi:MAG: hypothetical protein LBK52_02200 [Deltaproteobacteria bacterium]|jgi:uncharacterized OB-fold protein|nr:hypothetical protein [Deltaproteobacteria bacterium]
MLCPKCGYNSFEFNSFCPKCRKDLKTVREQLRLTSPRPGAVDFFSLLNPADQAQSGTRPAGDNPTRPGTVY